MPTCLPPPPGGYAFACPCIAGSPDLKQGVGCYDTDECTGGINECTGMPTCLPPPPGGYASLCPCIAGSEEEKIKLGCYLSLGSQLYLTK
jgi:hypothetical protein